MAIHFTSAEFETRIENLCRALNSASLDGILLFKQESMYYLTGYETFGFCFFQCLYLDALGRKMLITRAPDLRQAQHTSTIEDIRVWPDDASESAVHFLRRMLDDLGCRGQHLGIELDSYGLTARNWVALESELKAFCRLSDKSELVKYLRRVKSNAEMTYVNSRVCRCLQALPCVLDADCRNWDTIFLTKGDVLCLRRCAVGMFRQNKTWNVYGFSI